MSWVTILWVATPAAVLTLSLVHGMVWWRRPSMWGHGLFAITGVSVAFFAAGEYAMMRAETAEEFGRVVRLIHVPGLSLMVGLTLFLHVYLRAGRPWLIALIIATRVAVFAVNFMVEPNINFREISGLHRVDFLGEYVSVADGVGSPWMLLGQFNLLLFIGYALDVSIVVWRRGERRTALLLGGSATIFMLGGTLQVFAILWGVADIPFTMSLFFFLMLGVMAYELTNDVFRARRLAEDLNDSEERLGLVLEAAGAGVWSWDYETGRIWATPQARVLYGLSPDEEVTFERFLTAVHPDDRERIQRSALDALHRGTGYNAEYRAVFPDGETRWIKVQSRAQLKPSGVPDHMVSVLIDISQHKQSEGETSRLRLELAHLSRVMVMNQLSTSLAHEINQPLGAILNNATAGSLMLKKAGFNEEEIGAILADIAQDARRAGDVIRKIRGIVKKGDVQLEYLHLNPLVEDVVALLHASIVMSRVTLELDLAPDLPRIRADRVQLQQVLVNLITNAIDAMRNESVRELRIRTAAGSLGSVTASVGDTGSGLDGATASRLFEAFYTTKKDGLGMGLGICRSILQDHGGRIWAENNAQKGATFTFSLTAVTGDSP